MGYRNIIAILVGISCILIGCSVTINAIASEETEVDMLLRVAREHRFQKKSVQKAYNYYIKALESALQQAPTEDEAKRLSVSPRDSIDHPSVKNALTELVVLLESNPNFVSNITALEFLLKGADIGVPEAQHRLSSAYCTGTYQGLVPMDAGRGLLLEFMAALSGHVEANMGMGYRFLYGIGVPESCELAKLHYEIAANVAANLIENRGYPYYIERLRLSEADSVQKHYSGRKLSSEQEALDYYTKLASEGDTNAAVALADMYLQGTRYCSQDIRKGIDYLARAAVTGHVQSSGLLGYLILREQILRLDSVKSIPQTSESSSRDDSQLYVDDSAKDDQLDAFYNPTYQNEFDDDQFLVSSTTTSMLSVPATVPSSTNAAIAYNSTVRILKAISGDEEEILRLLRYAVNRGDPHGTVGLGLMYYRGYHTITPNISKAVELFGRVLNKHPDAGYYLGEIFMGKHIPSDARVKYDPSASSQYYSISSQRGNVLSLHRVSLLAAYGTGQPKSCSAAVAGLKSVAEKGDWMLSLNKAFRLYQGGHRDHALTLYSRLASIGIEVAQFNAGFILSKQYCPAWSKPPRNDPSLHSALSNTSLAESMTRPSTNDETAVLQSVLTISQVIPEEHGEALIREDLNTGDGNIEIELNSIDPANISFSVSVDSDLWKSLHGITTTSQENQAADVASTIRASANQSSHLTQRRLEDCQMRSYGFLSLSAQQGNAEAWLLLGDMHYYGEAGLAADKLEAALYYQTAADLKQTHAMFNLGVMYEIGDGVQQDFHLAKRYYDQAAEFDASARLPRSVAMVLMQSHQILLAAFGKEETDELVRKGLPMIKSFASKIASYITTATGDLARAQETSDDSMYGMFRNLLSRLQTAIETLFSIAGIEFDLSKFSIGDTKTETWTMLALAAAIVYLQGYRATRRRRQQELQDRQAQHQQQNQQ